MTVEEAIYKIWPFYREDKTSIKLDKSFIDDSVNSLLTHLQQQWLNDFLHIRGLPSTIKSLHLIDPRDIILLGSWLNVLKQTIQEKDFNLIVSKLKSSLAAAISNPDSGFQLDDVLAEVEVLAAFASSKFGHLIVEHATGVQGNEGEKNAEFYLHDKDVYVEVKSYHSMQSSRYQRFKKESSTLFKQEGNVGKAFVLDPKNQWSIKEQKYQGNGAAAAVQIDGIVTVQNLKKLLKKAEKKFTSQQTAIAVLDRVHAFEIQNALVAVNGFFNNRPDSPVKGVIIKTARNWGLSDGEWKTKVLYLGNSQICSEIFNEVKWPQESTVLFSRQ